jgi:hypothetical protein
MNKGVGVLSHFYKQMTSLEGMSSVYLNKTKKALTFLQALFSQRRGSGIRTHDPLLPKQVR